ncbi:3-dehydroquinate synthase [Robiginitalea myxolifaciens]|uniref:3-dehydroquinate synthase n=1 Tax=Robiginitalea myxolifaciens TaxID=400055 RepID=A0A1I6GWM4_9FLAO|nr:3-dehydroquinate synthase [Robiginitalea myxolifaciens]SFR46457.1 3-dehydroquinate synthase [Robiginitalea myxolifaciens]
MESLRSDAHDVFFGSNGFQELSAFLEKKGYSKVFLLTDTNTRRDCLPVLLEHLPEAATWELLEMAPGESNKQVSACIPLWQALSDKGADRKSILISLGGGVVTDLGGFVACTYQRGIDFINIPTSLLAMVDASVGGKTGVDLGSLKNQVGIIRQPEMVLVHSQFLKTLEKRELYSGFAEMLKHGLIQDQGYWENLITRKPEDIGIADIAHSVQIKNQVVIQDPTEKGLRKILNFGHTLGHAIESYFLTAENLPTLLHGEAIAAGMILEAHLATKVCQLPSEACDQIKNGFNQYFEKVAFEPEQITAIKSLMSHDKKNAFGTVKFALLETIGGATYNCEVSDSQLDAAFEYYKV